YGFVISESAKTQWPKRNKNKIPRVFLSGNSIKKSSGQLTVREVQLSSSSIRAKSGSRLNPSIQSRWFLLLWDRCGSF
ncbi:unnamed protein product, partial [Porites lobata]